MAKSAPASSVKKIWLCQNYLKWDFITMPESVTLVPIGKTAAAESEIRRAYRWAQKTDGN